MQAEQGVEQQISEQFLIDQSNQDELIGNNKSEMDYVEQYLNIKPLSSSLTHQEALENSNSSIPKENVEPSLMFSPFNSKKTKQKSIFHNFQKHLVTTLKRNITISKPNHSLNKIQSLAYEIWIRFLKSTIYTKHFIFFIFGYRSTHQNLAFQKQKRMINLSNLSQLFGQNSVEEIELAQSYLRNQVVQQWKRLNNSNLFKNRRIKRCEEFEVYFRSFMAELQEGEASKRLCKSKKNLLIQQIQDNQIKIELQQQAQ